MRKFTYLFLAIAIPIITLISIVVASHTYKPELSPDYNFAFALVNTRNAFICETYIKSILTQTDNSKKTASECNQVSYFIYDFKNHATFLSNLPEIEKLQRNNQLVLLSKEDFVIQPYCTLENGIGWWDFITHYTVCVEKNGHQRRLAISKDLKNNGNYFIFLGWIIQKG